MTQPVDSSILHEIVRLIESRRKVPEKVVVKAKEYVLTYLDDHQRRLEEALQRYDGDRLNMLYGQLASKIKYQLLRRLPGRAAEPAEKPKKTAKPAVARPAAKRAAKPALKAKSNAARKPAAKAKKPAAKRPVKRSGTGTRRAAARRR